MLVVQSGFQLFKKTYKKYAEKKEEERGRGGEESTESRAQGVEM